MIQATAAFAAELISGTSQPLGSSTTGDLWNLFHKNQSLYFTEFFQIYMETQPILYIIGILALLFLVLSAAYNCLYVIVRFGFDKCKVKRYQQHPTSTRLYAFLLMLFYLIWIVGMGTTLFFIYVTLIRKWTDTSHFDSDAVFESQGTDDDSFQVLDQIRDLSFSKNPVFSMEWVFNHVLKVIVPGNLILLLLAACATVVGTICYKNSRHPMDRSNTSNVMHNILAFCSGCSLLLLWVLVALGSTCFLYAHVHQNTCQEFQMRMQNDGIEKFVNSHNVSESQITEIAEMLADMEQERSEVNENICEAMARPYQVSTLPSMSFFSL
ncbi:hypothetical protein L596_002608 [Steinernema carpocapsae]|uniref:Uncharacterized protein n=1 Tax=Steinernema carpocapsae TaxID=34508 RepID=A0A4U8UTQ0_STECR|nr:hypothetical protein L596_002608 [Steinernema carpocapsae]